MNENLASGSRGEFFEEGVKGDVHRGERDEVAAGAGDLDVKPAFVGRFFDLPDGDVWLVGDDSVIDGGRFRLLRFRHPAGCGLRLSRSGQPERFENAMKRGKLSEVKNDR